MANHIFIIGNLVRDGDYGNTPSGVSYYKFTLAVNRTYTNSKGEREADYFDCICYRTLADRCAKYLSKGSKVSVHGSVQRRQYENRQGIKVTTFDVIADEVEFLTPSNKRGDTEITARENPQPHTVLGHTGQTAQNPTLFDDIKPVSQDEADGLPF